MSGDKGSFFIVAPAVYLDPLPDSPNSDYKSFEGAEVLWISEKSFMMKLWPLATWVRRAKLAVVLPIDSQDKLSGWGGATGRVKKKGKVGDTKVDSWELRTNMSRPGARCITSTCRGMAGRQGHSMAGILPAAPSEPNSTCVSQKQPWTQSREMKSLNKQVCLWLSVSLRLCLHYN